MQTFIFLLLFASLKCFDSEKIPIIVKNYDAYLKKYPNKGLFSAGGLSGSIIPYKKRKEIYKANIDEINRHNRNYNNGKVSYYLGVGQFTDWSDEEFQNNIQKSVKLENLSRKKNQQRFKRQQQISFKINNIDKSTLILINSLQEHIRYIASNVAISKLVTTVKNQYEKKCSSCTAFAAVASLEGQYARITNNLLSFSEQFLIDCGENKDMCENGGHITDHFEFLKKNSFKKFPLSDDYPYTGKRDECRPKFNKNTTGFRVTGYTTISSNNSKLIMKNLELVGPLAVYINAIKTFKDYKGGIIDVPELCNEIPNHAVTLVGYDKDSYLVKNSLGVDWGENGYFRIARKKCVFREDLIYPNLELKNTDQDCVEIEPSTPAGNPFNFTLYNDMGFNLSLYRIKSDYLPDLDTLVVEPNQSYSRESYENFAFVLVNKNIAVRKCFAFTLGITKVFKKSGTIVNVSDLDCCIGEDFKIPEDKTINADGEKIIHNFWQATDFPKYFKKINDEDWNEYQNDRLVFRFKQVENGPDYVILFDSSRVDYVRLDSKMALQGTTKDEIKWMLNIGKWQDYE